MGLGFENGAAGRQIFEAWRKKLGHSDEENRIRISIITGIDRDHPFAYWVVVGSNLPNSSQSGGPNQFMSVSRMQPMNAQSPSNLSGFIECDKRAGSFILLPVALSADRHSSEPFYDVAIRKKFARIVPAWQIGEHDMNCVAVLPEDRPIIPPGEKNAPVLKLLGSRRRQRPSSSQDL